MCDYASYRPCPKGVPDPFAEIEERMKRRERIKREIEEITKSFIPTLDTRKSPGIEFQEEYIR